MIRPLSGFETPVAALEREAQLLGDVAAVHQADADQLRAAGNIAEAERVEAIADQRAAQAAAFGAAADQLKEMGFR